MHTCTPSRSSPSHTKTASLQPHTRTQTKKKCISKDLTGRVGVRAMRTRKKEEKTDHSKQNQNSNKSQKKRGETSRKKEWAVGNLFEFGSVVEVGGDDDEADVGD
eukprot:3453553-Rhodomonas_salina.3